jgi:cytochrome P450
LKIIRTYSTTNPVLTVAEPELIKQILVKDFNSLTDRRQRKTYHPIIDKSAFFAKGDIWRRVRSISSPTFTSGKIKQMYPLVRDCLADFLAQLDYCAKNKIDINLKDVFGNFTMDVIARCAFGTKTNAHIDPNNPFVSNAKKIFNLKLSTLLAIVFVPKQILKAFKFQSFSNETANQFFFSLTRNIIEMRRKENKKYKDFVQLLMDAELEDKNNEDYHLSDEQNKSVTNKKLTEDEILGQAWIFFIAGYETTASTLSFCAYELALNPQIQEKLFNEINEAFDENTSEINYDILSKLPYLDACLSETLRLYPPVIRLERSATEDYKLGDTGLVIKKGNLIEIPVYGIHHSEEYYPNPELFDPERFMPENRDKIIPYTYLPFGAGPRLCLGMRFALMEAKQCLAHIIKNYRFSRNNKTDIPINFTKMTTLLQTKPIIVSIEKR